MSCEPEHRSRENTQTDAIEEKKKKGMETIEKSITNKQGMVKMSKMHVIIVPERENHRGL